MTDIAFAPEQEWAYDTRPEDTGSTLVIGKIEPLPHVRVIHIHVKGANIRNPRAPGGVSHALGHMPISEEALRRSVTRLVGPAAVDAAFTGGYEQWVRNEGGVFTISVREAIGYLEGAINTKQ